MSTTEHGQADIVREWLIQQDDLVLSMPGVGGEWPVFVSSMPDDPDEAVCIYDVAGTGDGRIMRTGQPVRFPGIQIRARSRDHRAAREKISKLVDKLNTLIREMIQVEDVQYLIHCLNQTTDIIPLGEEENRRRVSFVTNFRVTIPAMTAGDIIIPPIVSTQYLRLDGTNTMMAPLNLGGYPVVNVANPTSPDHAATKSYVDSAVGGVSGASSTYIAENKEPTTIDAGMPVAIHSTGVGVVKADADGNLEAVGLVRTSTIMNGATPVQTGGPLTLSDWTAIAGTPSLSPRAVYYLSTVPGRITNVPPSLGMVQQVGVAVAPDTLNIEIDQPIYL